MRKAVTSLADHSDEGRQHVVEFGEKLSRTLAWLFQALLICSIRGPASGKSLASWKFADSGMRFGAGRDNEPPRNPSAYVQKFAREKMELDTRCNLWRSFFMFLCNWHLRLWRFRFCHWLLMRDDETFGLAFLPTGCVM